MSQPLRQRLGGKKAPTLGAIAIAILAAVAQAYFSGGESKPAAAGADAPVARSAPAAQNDSAASRHQASDSAIDAAFAAQRSDVQVRESGRVVKILRDDNKGSRHQRFLVEIPSGRTVLVAHNIDLAPRAPIEHGDEVEIHGEYEWTEKGGVVHWTHHDPARRHIGGWIEHRGKRYE